MLALLAYNDLQKDRRNALEKHSLLVKAVENLVSLIKHNYNSAQRINEAVLVVISAFEGLYETLRLLPANEDEKIAQNLAFIKNTIQILKTTFNQEYHSSNFPSCEVLCKLDPAWRDDKSPREFKWLKEVEDLLLKKS